MSNLGFCYPHCDRIRYVIISDYEESGFWSREEFRCEKCGRQFISMTTLMLTTERLRERINRLEHGILNTADRYEAVRQILRELVREEDPT